MKWVALVVCALYLAVAVLEYTQGQFLAGVLWSIGACIWVFNATLYRKLESL